MWKMKKNEIKGRWDGTRGGTFEEVEVVEQWGEDCLGKDGSHGRYGEDGTVVVIIIRYRVRPFGWATG